MPNRKNIRGERSGLIPALLVASAVLLVPAASYAQNPSPAPSDSVRPSPSDWPELSRRLQDRWESERLQLINEQLPTGEFPGEHSAVVATARALWALAQDPARTPEQKNAIISDSDATILLRGCGFLFRNRKKDGGIYTRSSTAAHETVWALAALSAVQDRIHSPALVRDLPYLEKFLKTARKPEAQLIESWADEMRRKLAADGELSEADLRAIEFIEQCGEHESGREQQIPENWYERLPLYMAGSWPSDHPELASWRGDEAEGKSSLSLPSFLDRDLKPAPPPEFDWATRARLHRWREAQSGMTSKKSTEAERAWRITLARPLLTSPYVDLSDGAEGSKAESRTGHSTLAYRVATAAMLLGE